MTKYAGEGFRIRVVPKADDGKTVLTAAMVAGLTVLVWNPLRVKIVDDEAMTFNADPPDGPDWFFILNTADQPNGKYKIKATITGLDGRINFDYHTERLAREPIPAPPDP